MPQWPVCSKRYIHLEIPWYIKLSLNFKLKKNRVPLWRSAIKQDISYSTALTGAIYQSVLKHKLHPISPPNGRAKGCIYNRVLTTTRCIAEWFRVKLSWYQQQKQSTQILVYLTGFTWRTVLYGHVQYIIVYVFSLAIPLYMHFRFFTHIVVVPLLQIAT